MTFRLLLLPMLISAVDGTPPSSCTPHYSVLEVSTMCLYEDDPQAVVVPMTEALKQEILSQHNGYRASVNPTAADMQKMYWDEELAVVAAKWARVCQTGHDTLRGRYVPGYGIPIGQNFGLNFGTWTGAIESWFDESEIYVYGQHPNDYLGEGGWSQVAHYTQVVREASARVGCGKAICPDKGGVLVCNYAWGNPADLAFPYKEGASCSDCPDNCVSNLCDCQGKICLNGGTLDPNTCECTCLGLFTGDICETPICTGDQHHRCGFPRPSGFPESFCIYRNVRQLCPIMCGVCPEEN